MFRKLAKANKAISEEKCTSATRGVSIPSERRMDLISFSDSTCARDGTVSLINCAPAAASLRHCAADASTSDVCVLHIVCTTIGWSPPMMTLPTFTSSVFIFLWVIYHILGFFLQACLCLSASFCELEMYTGRYNQTGWICKSVIVLAVMVWIIQ